MSTLKIEERIVVSAPPARVWAFLLDPARVAPCLPGARLDGVEGDKTFLGTMKVKVGPVTMEFKGKATMTEIDEVARRVVLSGSGNDKGGSGSAKMAMESRIVALENGGSEILVVADVDLAGKLVGFGRGMMGGISKQMFKQFSDRVRAELAEEEVEAAPAAESVEEVAAPEVPPTASSVEAASPVEVAAIDDVAGEPPAEAPAEEEPTRSEAAPAEKAAPVVSAPSAPRKKKKKASAAMVPRDNAPLSAGNLVFAAFWDWFKGLFRRLFGR
jgi:carbon monoxide dehydrogenase subunit G